MESKNTSASKQTGGTRISRRTVTRGVAWSAPIAAVAYAAPAFAASPGPVVVTPCGTACKHPGSGQNVKTYHFTFCFATNVALVGGTVTLVSMTIVGGGGQTETKAVTPTTVSVAPGSPTCIYVDAPDFADSQNGQATLNFSYDVLGDNPDAGVLTGSVSTSFLDLPPCGTGADPGNNPQLPHDADGDETHVPTNCVS